MKKLNLGEKAFSVIHNRVQKVEIEKIIEINSLFEDDNTINYLVKTKYDFHYILTQDQIFKSEIEAETKLLELL